MPEYYLRHCRELKRERDRSGLSLREVGKQAGVPHTTVMRMEKGGEVSVFHYLALHAWAIKRSLTP